MLAVHLGSRSPRRRALLEAAGVSIVGTDNPDCDETWRAGEHPVSYARRVALAKAHATAAMPGSPPSAPILTADTTVWIRPDGAPLGKPRDAADLLAMLAALRAARRHHVTTAFTIAASGDPVVTEHVTTHVYLSPPPAAELASYLASDEWRDKAGGYAIQGLASAWASRIEGSYSSVVGLPTVEVVAALRRLRARRHDPAPPPAAGASA